MIAPVAIFAIGNRSRGDDAVGPLLLDRLRSWLECRGAAGEFDLIEEYQLQIEDALDLEGRRLALFIDASLDSPAAVTFGPVGTASLRSGHSTHALDPATLLGVYASVQGEAPPPAYVLGVRGTGFELGSLPSEAALDAMDEAWTLLRALVRCPRHGEWQTMAAVARASRDQPA